MREIQPELSLGLFFKQPTIAAIASAIEYLQKISGTVTITDEENREEFEF